MQLTPFFYTFTCLDRMSDRDVKRHGLTFSYQVIEFRKLFKKGFKTWIGIGNIIRKSQCDIISFFRLPRKFLEGKTRF